MQPRKLAHTSRAPHGCSSCPVREAAGSGRRLRAHRQRVRGARHQRRVYGHHVVAVAIGCAIAALLHAHQLRLRLHAGRRAAALARGTHRLLRRCDGMARHAAPRVARRAGQRRGRRCRAARLGQAGRQRPHRGCVCCACSRRKAQLGQRCARYGQLAAVRPSVSRALAAVNSCAGRRLLQTVEKVTQSLLECSAGSWQAAAPDLWWGRAGPECRLKRCRQAALGNTQLAYWRCRNVRIQLT